MRIKYNIASWLCCFNLNNYVAGKDDKGNCTCVECKCSNCVAKGGNAAKSGGTLS